MRMATRAAPSDGARDEREAEEPRSYAPLLDVLSRPKRKLADRNATAP